MFQKQVDQLTQLLMRRQSQGVASSASRRRNSKAKRVSRPNQRRAPMLEAFEPRYLMAADAIQIGGVYVEEDTGNETQGDLFTITFQGGAANTELTRLVIDGDLNRDGFSLGDLFFDTAAGGLGAESAYGFQIEELRTANAGATVQATVQDGSTRLVLDFTNFRAGDVLVFSIDVDEVQFFDPNETDLDKINENLDPITSGIEFQNTHFEAEFSAPHFEDASGQSRFRNRYDEIMDPTGLPLPRDNDNGKKDRSAGAVFELTQQPKPVSLSGMVYVDLDEDLLAEAGEPRLAGVEIELFYRDADGVYRSTGHSTTTDSQGRYTFGTALGLMPGTYQIRQSQPGGYYSVGATLGRLNGQSVGQTVPGNPDQLTQIRIANGDSHVTDLNFAENLPSTISGHVRVLVDGFDCTDEDAVEEPLEGVLLELRDSSGKLVATTRSAADGSYQFTNLRAGNYTVTEITPVGLLEGGSHVGSVGGVSLDANTISTIVVGGGTRASDYDFCEVTPSTLSGRTFYDANDNGVRDAGETLLANVRITLWSQDGERIAETRTNANGYYEFRGLAPGEYRLTEETPAGYIPGQAVVGKVDGQAIGQSDNTGDVIAFILLPAGAQGIDYDFGELRSGSISGRVFADADGNCVFDVNGDLPLAGVTLELWGEGGNVLQTTVTDALGRYTFDDLLPAVYSVHQIQPAGYLQGSQHVGSGGGDASQQDLISQIRIASGDDLVDYDFCELEPGSIAGQVFADRDGDRLPDADEPLLSGVRIELLNEQGTVIQTTHTDAAGRYQFVQLRPGNYSVRETQPSGYFQGGQRAPATGGDDSVADLISGMLLAPGQAIREANFYELEPGSIAGRVFADRDGDQVPDADEPHLSGVRIELLNEQGNVVQTTTTNAEGRYRFDDLRPGTYSVREIQPEGYFHGGQRAPATGGDDSLADVISGIVVAPARDVIEANFYELEPGSISGNVFADLDADCAPDANESGLAGVRIDLLDAGGNVLQSTTTNANGDYTFENLRPGAYSIREIQPAGYFQGGQTAPAGNGDASLPDLISGISVAANQHVRDANFCEQPPASISGYVFQDGEVILSVTGELPDNLREIRDGQRTADDTPLAGVLLELRAMDGSSIASSQALPGSYGEEVIRVRTDANGYFVFTGLRAGTYHIYQQQPEGYLDGLDTPGSTTGYALNPGEQNNVPDAILNQIDTSKADPGTDAILAVRVTAGQSSIENNFSELVTRVVPVTPPVEPLQQPLPEFQAPLPDSFTTLPPLLGTVATWTEQPLLIGAGHDAPPSWHLSVINGGKPRGALNGEPVDEALVKRSATVLDVVAWNVKGLNDQHGRIVSLDPTLSKPTPRLVFDLPGSVPIAGDFNGDGFDELALFVDGEWFIDLNGNGRWDESDIWLKLGTTGDQPVVGDWDGDGKDDVGVFGSRWPGDGRAVAREPGLPDPENKRLARPKNTPPGVDEAPDDPRILKPSAALAARADLIDHVFRFGGSKDIAVSGDFNGDGITSIGTFRDGRWILDVDGDGRLRPDFDKQVMLGQAGDLPLVGDFIGQDGIDELAIVRGNQVFVDSNGNGRIDATDQVFTLESEHGHVIAGDFDGDGKDEPVLHQTARDRSLQAARESANY